MKRQNKLFPFVAIALLLLLGWAAPAALQEASPEAAAEPLAAGEAVDEAPEGASEGQPGKGAQEEPGESAGEESAEPSADPEMDGLDDGAEDGDGDPEAGGPPADLPVRAIVVRGNRNVDVSLILDAITETRVGDPLEYEAIRTDLRNIAELGYFADVTVNTVLTEGGLRVVFQVVENPVITELRVEADEELDADEIRRLLRVREGEVLNSVHWYEDLERIQEMVQDKYGYDVNLARADLTPDGVLDVGFTITRVRDVVIQGNQKTKDFVIRREISVEPGEPLRWHDLRNSLDRLQRLGFFQDVRTSSRTTDHPDYLDIVFDVEERLTGTALVGAGYSSEDGLLGYAELADRNFLGRGQHASVRAQFGQRRTVYDLSFYEPYLFGSRNSFGFNVYSRALDRFPVDRPEYRERRSGGDVVLGRALSDTTRVSLRYRMENMRTEALDENNPPAELKSGRTRSVTLSAFADTTDHWLSPMRGHRGRISAELGGGFLGGDFHFTKYEAEYSRYFRVGSQRQAIAVRALGGLGVGDIRPAEEQFRVGGADTVRGYAANRMEGDRMLVLNAEYRFPLSESVQGVIFTDAGEAWDKDRGPSGLKLGYGIGARLDTPLGVLRLDYGIGDEGGRLHFFFGPSF